MPRSRPTEPATSTAVPATPFDKKTVKPLAQVKEEIDLALKKRNLQAITVLGGEPTLYPGLEEVVACVKSLGLFCQLLGNGLVFVEERGDERLDRLLLHVDSGQSHVHKDLEAVRRVLFAKCEAKRLHFGLSLTIYNEDRGRLPELLGHLSAYKYFDGILAVLARDPHPPGTEQADLAAEYRSLADAFGILPTAYVPSNLSDTEMRWLFYLYFINARTKRTFPCSPRIDRAFRQAFRIVRELELFTTRWPPSFARLCFALAGLFEAARSPWRIGDISRVGRGSRAGRDIRFQFIVIQTPPEVRPLTGQFIFCHHFPDATIRNGRLAPVCVADHISPLPGEEKAAWPGEDSAAEIYRHLGEECA